MHSPNVDLKRIGCYTDVVSYYLLNAMRRASIEVHGCGMMSEFKDREKVFHFLGISIRKAATTSLPLACDILPILNLH